METRSALTKGTMLRQYRIEEILGQGGFGITYLATDTDLQRLVALKECYPRDFVSRDQTTVVPTSTREERDFDWALGKFVDEATTLAKFKHPGIVQVLQIIKGENNTAYIVLEYVEGQPLDKWMGALKEPLSEGEVRDLVTPIFDALEMVHKKGIAHRDIAPDNIYIRSSGEAVLLDFGAAKQVVGHHTRTMNLVVKDGYSAPEQYYAEGKQGPWTDVYAFAATLYHLIAGKRPSDAMARQDAVHNEEPDPLRPLVELNLDGYSEKFLTAVMSGLTLSTKARPRSLEDWRIELLGAARSEQLQQADRSNQQTKRRGLPLAAPAIGLLVLVGVAGYLFVGYQEKLALEARIAAEEAAWQEAFASDTPEGYQAFIRSHPMSGRIADAEKALKALDTPWTLFLGGDAPEHASAISSGHSSIAVAGTIKMPGTESVRGLLYLLSLSGRERWRVEFGENNVQSIQDVKILKDGTIVLVGFQTSPGSNAQNAFVAKYSSKGDEIWRHVLDNGASNRLTAIEEMSNGDLVAVGDTTVKAGDYPKGWIVRLNALGSVNTQFVYDNEKYSSFNDVKVIPDGDLAIVGSRVRPGGADKNFWLARVTAAGEFSFDNVSGGIDYDAFVAVSVTKNGEFYAVGETLSLGTQSVDALIARVNRENKMTPRAIAQKKDDYLTSIVTTNDGGVLVAGYTSSTGAGLTDGWVTKYDANLEEVEWVKVIGDSGVEKIEAIDLLENNSIVTAGISEVEGGDTASIWVMKIGPNGEL